MLSRGARLSDSFACDRGCGSSPASSVPNQNSGVRSSRKPKRRKGRNEGAQREVTKGHKGCQKGRKGRYKRHEGARPTNLNVRKT